MKTRRLPLKKMILLGGYIRNPVLVQVIGICPAAAATTSLLNAVVLSAVFTLSLILCEVIASLLLKKVSRWIRMGLYSVIGMAVVFPVMYLLEKYELSSFSGLGIYLPLMVMSSLNCVHCEKFAVKHPVKASLYDAVASSVGYCTVLLLVGLIREIAGSGTVLRFDIAFIDGLSGILMPFGGLLVIGILAAIHKAVIQKNYPDKYSEHETKFTLDESDGKESTFTYAVKQRFGKQ